MKIAIMATLLFLTACLAESPPVQDASAGELGAQREPAPELAQLACPPLEVDAGTIEPVDVEPLIFTLDAVHCTGHWADNSDSSTRFGPHPDTGLCSFSCVWLEPKCRESWYGDQRCYPAHAAVLGELCANLGGTCALDAHGLSRWCVAP